MNILLSPLSDPGYLYPVLAVGRERQRRGDTVHVLGGASAASATRAAGLAWISAADCGAPLAFSAGRWFAQGADQYRATRRAAEAVRADAVITSVLCHGPLVAAEALDLPVVVMGFAAYLWAYRSGPEAASRVRWESGMTRRYRQIREDAGLPAHPDARGPRTERVASTLPLLGSAFLLRGDQALEEPGAMLPDGVHHIGPCFWEPPAEESELEYVDQRLRERGKPVVYVHLGRYFGGTGLWPALVAAFTGGRYQAVVERGRTEGPGPTLAADVDVVVLRKPWMGPLLRRAELVLTNATSAPVLGALLHGRPLVVAPEGSEQNLLAGACVRAGVASYLGGSEQAAATFDSVVADKGLQARARTLGAKLAAAPGPVLAADLVERAVTGRARSHPEAVAHV